MNLNLRDQIPSLKNKIYFNYGGQGPLPKPSLDEIIKSWEIIQEIGPFTNNVWEFINKETISTKLLLSKILGVNTKNIALSENISTGIVLPLWGIKFNYGDELLISDCEHPGIIAACRELCRRNNLELNIFPIQKIKGLESDKFISEFTKYLNKKTRVVIISHLLWNYGFKIPLKELSKEINKSTNDPFLIVDGAQSFGHLDIKDQVKYSDIYAITSHKWACGPEGLGAFFVSDRFLNSSNPTIIGWKSLKREQGIYEPFDDLYQKDARKYEIATSCIPLLAGLRKSLKLLKIDQFEEERNKTITTMSNKLWIELNNIENINLVLDYPLDNGIVSFDIEGIKNKQRLINELGKRNIWIRIIEDPRWFRACIHQMTTSEEINLFIKQIKLILQSTNFHQGI
ncbi:MAG: cysteine lyase [Prochlorococcus sp. SP3034]|nr:cysteine lyase [Prochlorococcus sp. SP3034]|tara:strand:- start:2991 stop:4190 length:1200 start_codon:yes stop_codon:yes gene_type:complete